MSLVRHSDAYQHLFMPGTCAAYAELLACPMRQSGPVQPVVHLHTSTINDPKFLTLTLRLCMWVIAAETSTGSTLAAPHQQPL